MRGFHKSDDGADRGSLHFAGVVRFFEVSVHAVRFGKKGPNDYAAVDKAGWKGFVIFKRWFFTGSRK
jgi:hypothetical protein